MGEILQTKIVGSEEKVWQEEKVWRKEKVKCRRISLISLRLRRSIDHVSLRRSVGDIKVERSTGFNLLFHTVVLVKILNSIYSLIKSISTEPDLLLSAPQLPTVLTFDFYGLVFFLFVASAPPSNPHDCVELYLFIFKVYYFLSDMEKEWLWLLS